MGGGLAGEFEGIGGGQEGPQGGLGGSGELVESTHDWGRGGGAGRSTGCSRRFREQVESAEGLGGAGGVC